MPPTAQQWSRLQTAHLQTAHALRVNSEAFVSHYGLDFTVFSTLTLKDRLYPIPAKRKLSAALKIYPEYFDDWLWTFGLGQDRRIHFHTLCAARENIADGIDRSLYHYLLDPNDDALSLLNPPLTRAELRKRLAANPALQRLRRDIYPRLHQLGFGHQLDISPVLSTAEAVAAYMHRNYIDTVRRRTSWFRGVRLTGYKSGGHRVCRPPFAWTKYDHRRQALRIVANALGVSQYEDMKSTFGPKWGYLSGLMLAELESCHGKDPSRWSAASIHHLAINEGMMPFN